MRLRLLLDPELIPAKGSYLYVPSECRGAIEEWAPDCQIADFWAAMDSEVDALDKVCGALLDLSDVDFLDWMQCEKLAPWLERRLSDGVSPIVQDFYKRLLEYAGRAVSLRTGVEVEL